MPAIIHLVGTQCSGKTWALRPFRDNPVVVIWDIYDFHVSRGILKDGIVDWRRWGQHMKDMEAEISFLIRNQSKTVIIESAGNETIDNVLRGIRNTRKIHLGTPDPGTLADRAALRGIPAQKVIDFAADYKRRIKEHTRRTYTQQGVREYISKCVSCL